MSLTNQNNNAARYRRQRIPLQQIMGSSLYLHGKGWERKSSGKLQLKAKIFFL
ncbi:hypothetical protein PI95_004810 [Hassallia byssoidea VB512170]|uniref:Uncharacterized protein n=1 Tax=Hassallia byssoidea VB512170 TaxID=1304833 RepID=A0A846H3E3_9CYAN|nr:hypothetical protein [Hassalia byssoidea VB512170]